MRGWRSLRLAAAWIAGAGVLAVVVHAFSTEGEAEARAGSSLLSVADTRAGRGSSEEPGPSAVRYGRDVRPLLSDRCFQCHGFDPATRSAGLRLDIRDEAIAPRKDSSPAIVPGNPGASELIRRVTSDDANVRMPPADSHKRALTPAEVELLRAWIDAGAEYEPHWAFVPPKQPALPAVSAASSAWGRNNIDTFVAAELERAGILPSPEADPATLVRRVFLDVTGLPPTLEEVEAFENAVKAERKPGAAYTQLVDRLLSEEPYVTRYAERMTAAWLDQARYADTCGIHMDAGRQMWLWRDWVIHAYRSNMPFDQFIIEQLAGDLIPDATVAQKIATGFNRNHVTTDEGGAIDEEYLVEYAVDRTSTTGSVLLGLTVGCARCHDHKFDPITAEDFYSLYSYFNSIQEPGLYSQLPDPNRAFEPFIAVPTAAQKERLDAIGTEVAALRTKLEERTPEEDSQRAAFFSDLWARAGIAWAPVQVVSAESAKGATLAIQPDGSVVASGTNPPTDEHTIRLRTAARDLRLISLEAMLEPSAPGGRVGRAGNGNAVLSAIRVEAVSALDSSRREPVKLVWAWADHSQQNGDFDVTNIIDDESNQRGDRGWALQGHETKQPRTALLLADKPFGFEGGTELVVTLNYNSQYSEHTLARVRLSASPLNDAGLSMLPSSPSRWYIAGPFPGDRENRVFEPSFGPEQGDRIDFTTKFGDDGKFSWRFDEQLRDGAVLPLAGGRNATYLGKYVYSPVAREVTLSLGSDDGFRIYVNGELQAERSIERSVAANQDQGTIRLRAGRNAVVMKIVNTGGEGGYFYQGSEVAALAGDLVAALLPHSAPATATPPTELQNRIERAWRVAALPKYKETEAAIAVLDTEKKAIEAAVPLTMVMKELETPRPTYVLTRGSYDKPDKARPVTRRVPAALGTLPSDAPANRLGLAQWIMGDENPLTARVTVNRLWEMLFGNGIVRTSEDFGLQGEWPSHPELLDWLAVEFRDGTNGNAWDVRHILRLILTSATYRQSSVVRTELRERDPDNRLLAYYPRRRLTAEQIRDQALFVSGLLVEKTGGASVKPYQPDGLWQEVAMLQSNTRIYVRGTGDDLWRRSMYTYWKRAAPPPAMLTFDAPTREFCAPRRATTSTPLQALVLWNDEQFVEAARVFAERTLADAGLDDDRRLERLFQRCLTRSPSSSEMGKLRDALGAFRERYKASPADAEGILKLGMSPRKAGIDDAELAAWTMIASSVMNAYEATTQK